MEPNALEVVAGHRKLVAELRQQVFAASTIPEVKVLLAAAKTVETAIRELGALDEEATRAQCEVSELVLRTKRRVGELLATMELNQGGRPRKTGSSALPVSAPTLNDLGLDKFEASRCQRIAEVPKQAFEHYIADTVGNGKQATQSAVLRLAPVPVARSAKRRIDWASIEDKVIGAVRRLIAKCPVEYRQQMKAILLTLADECGSNGKVKQHG